MKYRPELDKIMLNFPAGIPLIGLRDYISGSRNTLIVSGAGLTSQS